MKKESPHDINTQTNEVDVSRRSFIKMAGLGLGLAATTTGCDGRPAGGDGWVPAQYEGKGNFPPQVRGRIPIDPLNPSICRDDQKCILCGQCAEVCDKAEAVFGHYELPMLNDTPCIHCGQCTLWCPTGAISETSGIAKALAALENPDIHVVAQTAPSTRVGLGEEFGLPVGTNVEGLQVAALRKLGANVVFDTNFTADLTIIEEATELVSRITGKINAPIPMFTSCCPGWVKFCEYFYPELLPNLSTAKSPQGMLSTLIKTYYAEKEKIDLKKNPEKIFNLSIMPCTAKKFEASRHELNGAAKKLGVSEIQDTDVVLTTRELAKLMKMKGIDLTTLTSYAYDKVLSEYSGGGAIFGATGGVMEAAVRTAYFYLMKENPPKELYKMVEPIRGLMGIKSAELPELDIPGVGKLKIRIAVVHGMDNARELLEDMRNGSPKFGKFHFIEFMACPGGCISGGGQPKSSLPPSDKARKARTDALYTIDEKRTLRLSHENPEIKALYENWLGEPNVGLAHELLHTHHYDENRCKNLVAKKGETAE